MLTFRRLAFAILAAFTFAATGAGCSGAVNDGGSLDTSATGIDAQPATSSELAFTDIVWRVAQSTSVTPGQLYVFLSDGTLLIASPNGTPSLGKWNYDRGELTMIEEGIHYRTEILQSNDSVFRIRSHNPGEAVEVTLVPARSSRAVSSTSPTTVRVRFTAPESRSGQLVFVDGQLRFNRCGESARGELVEDVASGEAAAILREFGSAAKIVVLVQVHDNRIIQVRYAGPEGLSCERLPREGELTAQGNEPFWSVRIQRDTASYSSPETDGEVAYLDGSWSRTATGSWRYTASRLIAGRTEQLELVLTEERCVDSMSAARFPFRAVLVRDGTGMTGCALEGRQAAAN